jgi:phage baseplate assembly protein W
MALSPLRPTSERATEITTVIPPSKTYALDLSTEEVSGGTIDGLAAVKQFVQKAIVTARFRFQAYTPNYGCEIDDLIGQDVPQALLDSEIPRVITDALIYDARINNVSGFVITRTKDGLYVEFTVDSIYGTTNGEVTL